MEDTRPKVQISKTGPGDQIDFRTNFHLQRYLTLTREGGLPMEDLQPLEMTTSRALIHM